MHLCNPFRPPPSGRWAQACLPDLCGGAGERALREAHLAVAVGASCPQQVHSSAESHLLHCPHLPVHPRQRSVVRPGGRQNQEVTRTRRPSIPCALQIFTFSNEMCTVTVVELFRGRKPCKIGTAPEKALLFLSGFIFLYSQPRSRL